MLKAARDYFLDLGGRLSGAWHDLRARGLFRLFLFEFAVVLLGVLAAQAVANWASERTRLADMETARANAERAIAIGAKAAEYWDVAIPCLEQQMTDVMRAADGEVRIDPTRLRRPAMRVVGSMEVPPHTLALIQQRYGIEYEQHIREALAQAQDIDHRISLIQDEWRAFALVDPQFGEPRDADYRAARRAAAGVLQILGGMRINSGSLQGDADSLRLERIDPYRGRAARNCDEVWRYGRVAFTASELDERGLPNLPRLDLPE